MSMVVDSYRFAAAGGAFNPETDITWTALYWTEGTAFTALGLTNGASVSTWPNETAATDLGTPATDPVYTASNATFNSKPTIAGGEASYFQHTTGTVTQPLTIVVVGRFARNDVARTLISDGTGAEARVAISGSQWRLYAGTVVDGGTSDTNAHLFVVHYDGASSFFKVDGTNVLTGNPGTWDPVGLSVFATFAGTQAGGVAALVGMVEGDFTANGSYADFNTWAEDHYGLTIA